MKTGVLLSIFFTLTACRPNPVKTSLPYFNTPDFTPSWIDTTSAGYQHLHTIPSFSFTDQNGDIITDKTVTGKIYVVDFFFTRCGSICPKMTNNMAKIATTFIRDKNVLMLSHSVTPELDNIQTLKAYAKRKNISSPNWHLLTGSKTMIYDLARKGYFADELTGYNKNASEFLHTENFVLVDRNRHIRGVYNGTIDFEMDNLIRHIKLLEQE